MNTSATPIRGSVAGVGLGENRQITYAPKISVDLSSQVVTVSVVVRNPSGASFSERVVVRTNGFDGIRRHEILWREIGPVAAPPTATPVKDE